METGGYWHALDRQGLGNAGELEIDPLRIGISHGIGDVGEGLKANIFRGLRTVELGFFGTGKGFRSQPTGSNPESFGTQEREDMRHLARINEVELSTHAAPDLGPLSGFDGRQFSKEQKEGSLQEVRRALDFAAETARGGAVVVHIGSRNGEFPRAIFEADEQFLANPEERKRAPLNLVNEETGQVIQLPRTLKLPEPVYSDPETKKNIVMEDGKIKYVYRDFEYYDEKAREEAKKEGKDTYDAGEYIYKQFRKKEQELAHGESLRYMNIAQEGKKQHDALQKVYDNFKIKLEDGSNVEAVRTFVREQLQQRGIFPEKSIDREEFNTYLEKPEVFLQETIKQLENNYKSHEEIAISRGRDARQVEEEMKQVKPIQEYALGEIKDSLARAAIEAYRMEKSRGLEQPLFISPENWSPESYGSHPKEYREVIIQSREEMANRLMHQEGMNKQQAQKIAEDHIRGTFDVGHLNFWRKYFQPSEAAKSDPKKIDEEFRKWIDKETEGLARDGVIGNVHLSDNFGYHDEHLAPGQGNAPIEKFAEKLEKYGYKGKYIGEPGGQKEGFYHTAWTGALNTLRSPIYRVGNSYARWSDMEHSYFGNVPQSPGFLVGDIVPSKDWTLWSETPLE